jgi:hypothetical protein
LRWLWRLFINVKLGIRLYNTLPQAKSLTSRLWRFITKMMVLFAPGSAAEGPLRGFVPQAQAV